MSAAAVARNATQEDLKGVLAEVKVVSTEVASMKATSAAETATLRAGQEHLRADLIERDTRTRRDIHEHNGKLDDLNGKLYLFKEELKDDLSKKFDELGNKLTAEVVKNSKNENLMKVGQALILAIVLAALNAGINLLTKH